MGWRGALLGMTWDQGPDARERHIAKCSRGQGLPLMLFCAKSPMMPCP